MSGEGTHDVVGICPACGWRSLTLAAGGYVTCTRLDCPNPCSATDLLEAAWPRVVTPDGRIVLEDVARSGQTEGGS